MYLVKHFDIFSLKQISSMLRTTYTVIKDTLGPSLLPSLFVIWTFGSF
jgi:hypothetical protein